MDNVLQWKPFNFSLLVSNTVGDSPFTDYFHVKGPTNGNGSKCHYLNCFYTITLGDLPIHNYTYSVESNERSVSVTWETSSLPLTLLESQFITGYTYHLYAPNGIVMVEDSTNSSHVFDNLEPDMTYYVASKIQTSDKSSWGPEMLLKNVTTKGRHYLCIVCYSLYIVHCIV